MAQFNFGLLRRLRSFTAHLLHLHSGQPLVDHNYRYLLLAAAWYGPVEGGIVNYLPVFLARLGASASLISLLTAAPSLIGILTFIPGGAYAERHPDLVKLVVRAALLGRSMYLLIGLLPWFLAADQVAGAAVILWTLSAATNAIHVPAWTAVMQKAIPPERRALLNGTRWALMSLISGALIAAFGVLLDRAPFPLGYQLVFLASFGATCINLYYFGKVLVPPFVPQRMAVSRGRPADRLRAFLWPLVENRAFVRLNIASLIYRLTLAMPAGLFSLYWVQELRANDVWIGLRGTAGYGALVLGYWFWGWVTNRIGNRAVLLLSGGCMALYPILTALAPSVEWLPPIAALWGATAAGLDIGFFNVLLTVCPEGRQPSFAAAANVIISIAVTIGPLLGAALSGIIGIRLALLVIGCAQAIGTAFFLLLPTREQEGLR